MDFLPVRPLIKSNTQDGAWIAAQRAAERRRFKAIICSLKYSNESDFTNEGHKILVDKTKEYLMFDRNFILELSRTVDPKKIAVITANMLNLSESTDRFDEFCSVYKIDVSGNNLELECFKSFPQLQQLGLSGNKIQQVILDDPLDFPFLNDLDLSNNQIRPEEIKKLGLLPQLRKLNLSNNQLLDLPLNLCLSDSRYSTFIELEDLNLSHNRLASPEIFAIFAACKKLKHFNLSDNLFQSVPLLKSNMRLISANTVPTNNYDMDLDVDEHLFEQFNDFMVDNAVEYKSNYMGIRIPSTLPEVDEEATSRSNPKGSDKSNMTSSQRTSTRFHSVQESSSSGLEIKGKKFDYRHNSDDKLKRHDTSLNFDSKIEKFLLVEDSTERETEELPEEIHKEINEANKEQKEEDLVKKDNEIVEDPEMSQNGTINVLNEEPNLFEKEDLNKDETIVDATEAENKIPEDVQEFKSNLEKDNINIEEKNIEEDENKDCGDLDDKNQETKESINQEENEYEITKDLEKAESGDEHVGFREDIENETHENLNQKKNDNLDSEDIKKMENSEEEVQEDLDGKNEENEDSKNSNEILVDHEKQEVSGEKYERSGSLLDLNVGCKTKLFNKSEPIGEDDEEEDQEEEDVAEFSEDILNDKDKRITVVIDRQHSKHEEAPDLDYEEDTDLLRAEESEEEEENTRDNVSLELTEFFMNMKMQEETEDAKPMELSRNYTGLNLYQDKTSLGMTRQMSDIEEKIFQIMEDRTTTVPFSVFSDLDSRSVTDIIRFISNQDSSQESNQIHIKPYPSLENLDLSFNKIKDERGLIPLIGWINLCQISIFNNPLTLTRTQKSSFIKALLENTFKIRVDWLPPIDNKSINKIAINKCQIDTMDRVSNLPTKVNKFLLDPQPIKHIQKIPTDEIPRVKEPLEIIQENKPTAQNNELMELTNVGESELILFDQAQSPTRSNQLIQLNRTANIRHLKYIVEHPITYFERNIQLYNKQNKLNPVKKLSSTRKLKKQKHLESKRLLEQQPNAVYLREEPINDVLSPQYQGINKVLEYRAKEAQQALDDMQAKYDNVRYQSLMHEKEKLKNVMPYF